MQSFTSLIGQTQAIALLEGAITANRIAPAYLFAGPPGVGRSLAARAFIERVFCTGLSPEEQVVIQRRLQQGNHPDVLWVEPTYLHNGVRLSAAEAAQKNLKRKAPPQIRLEQIREITQFLGRRALSAPRKVVVIEQAETMAEAAANGLLKTLEEPGNATLILLALSPESLLATLVSRCQRVPFKRLSHANLAQVLQKTGHAEILKEPSVLALAQGSPGEAIAAFTQLQAIPKALLSAISSPPKTPRQALELARDINKTLAPQAQLWLLDYLQHCYWQSHASPSLLQHLEQARNFLLSHVQSRLVWEVTLLELVSS